MANHFGREWETYASDNNFPQRFISSKNTNNYTSSSYPVHKTASLMENPITMLELNSCLNKVKGSTPGLDRISYQMIKPLTHNTKEKLLSLYNTIFQSGQIPHFWKLAVVVPIPKNTNSYTVESFRPISLLPCMSKIIERIIAARLSWFTEKRKLIAKEQVAFRSNKSCDDALLHLDHYITKVLSARNHATVLSIDFEKAFDRIGSHVILNILKSWSIGPKIHNFVKSFLSNRRFKVRVNGHLSRTFALNNGIPQGSPLSVVLFQIAFNEISKIIINNPAVDHCLYADDLYILCKRSSNLETKTIFESLLCQIHDWAEYSGAKISLQKTKKLHFCRKHYCDSEIQQIQTNGFVIQNVKKLKILGVTFSTRYNWKDHCTELKNAIIARANIIRYLAIKSFVHINTLTYLTKTLVLSKIDYGMLLYGNSCKSTINIIKPAYHKAARASVYAHRTSPINNILNEAGLPTIEERIFEVKARILPKLLTSTNSIIDNDIASTITAKRPKRIKSAIAESLNTARIIGIPLETTKTTINKPPWKFRSGSIDLSIAQLKKNDTNKNVYFGLFLEKKAQLANNGWKFVYTDGTKTQGILPAYAVVSENGTSIVLSILQEHSSIFTAESCAIYRAIQQALDGRDKTIIFTDSLSVLKAVANPYNNKWNTIQKIRDLLIDNEDRIRICWIPSHIGIVGNDKADIAAKYAAYAPIISDPIFEKIDIRRQVINFIKHKNKNHIYHYHYSHINPSVAAPTYPTGIDKEKIKTFSRLRLGHTIFSHSHKINRTPAPICNRCNGELTIKHLLIECPQLSHLRDKHFSNKHAFDLLQEPSTKNINKIFNFVKQIHVIV